MEFIKLAEERYSVRKFSKKSVEKEKLELILRAGQLAPTACNNQPQRILVIESEEFLLKLKKCTPYHFNAPMAILVCYDDSVSWRRVYDNKDGGEIDASIVAAHMMLQVAQLGMGTTWVGHFDPVAMKKEFNLPENIIPVVLLPLGYPAEDATPSAQHYKRKPLEETVGFNSF